MAETNEKRSKFMNSLEVYRDPQTMTQKPSSLDVVVVLLAQSYWLGLTAQNVNAKCSDLTDAHTGLGIRPDGWKMKETIICMATVDNMENKLYELIS